MFFRGIDALIFNTFKHCIIGCQYRDVSGVQTQVASKTGTQINRHCSAKVGNYVYGGALILA